MPAEEPARKPAKPARPATPKAAKPAAPLKKAAPAAAAPASNGKDVQAESKRQAAQAQAASGAATAEADEEEESEEEAGPGYIAGLLRDSPSWLMSLIVHLVILMVLGLWMLPAQLKEVIGSLSVSPNDGPETEEVEELQDEPLEEVEVETTEVPDVPTPVTEIQPVSEVMPATDMEAAAVAVELSDFGDTTAMKSDLLAAVGGTAATGVGARSNPQARAAAVKKGGGSEASEKAVAMGLKWLAEHQMPDGSWSFDHTRGLCQGRCPHPGKFAEMTNGATAMGLLPFLGSGQTHKEGTYKKNVAAGLMYLGRKMKVSAKGGSLEDPGHGMYSHGLCAIALCEAYAMTQDKGLHAPAQAAAMYCATGQDPIRGGWIYNHGAVPGNDLSVAGWQIMALKSAHMGYLEVPPIVVKRSYDFLDSVQADSGSAYGYRSPGNGPATSAVGLLCRMYLGWKKDNPALERGVQRLAKMGPSPNNMYFNYYAQQVMFQFTGGEGEMWKKWNDAMREMLIASQAKEGHATGSWNNCNYASHGGRVYATSLSCLALEVYYRHMPIFKAHEKEGEDFFPE